MRQVCRIFLGKSIDICRIHWIFMIIFIFPIESGHFGHTWWPFSQGKSFIIIYSFLFATFPRPDCAHCNRRARTSKRRETGGHDSYWLVIWSMFYCSWFFHILGILSHYRENRWLMMIIFQSSQLTFIFFNKGVAQPLTRSSPAGPQVDASGSVAKSPALQRYTLRFFHT